MSTFKMLLRAKMWLRKKEKEQEKNMVSLDELLKAPRPIIQVGGEIMPWITLKDYATSNNKYPSNLELVENDDKLRYLAEELLKSLNLLQIKYGKPFIISSGFRDNKTNALVGGAQNSLHTKCLACDIVDNDGELDKWCMAHQDILKSLGLYLEHPFYTKNWCHLQVDAPKSGKRVFIPYSSAPKDKDRDNKFNTLMFRCKCMFKGFKD